MYYYYCVSFFRDMCDFTVICKATSKIKTTCNYGLLEKSLRKYIFFRYRIISAVTNCYHIY